MSRFRLFSLLAILALALALASCGTAPKHSALKLRSSCPAGASQMGCAIPHSSPGLSINAAPTGRKFPDVSSWQGHPNWAAAKASISMAVVKAGEYVEDADFAWNISQLKALGIKWAPYWFVRNTGCTHEGAEIVSVLRSVGGLTSLPLVLDMEVPEASGYAVCLANAVHAALGRWPIIYTAPGTWPGGATGNLSLWAAAYGPVRPCVWTCTLVGWQFTDGRIGAPTFIPGIGFGDVSVDLGFSKLMPVPAVNHHYARFPSSHFRSPYGVLNERTVVERYDRARQHRASLTTLEPELAYLAARDAAVAKAQRVHGKPSWGRFYRGWRYQELIHRSAGRAVTS